MAHISEIKMNAALSNNGNLKITDTVARACYNIRAIGRKTASAQDVAFVINNNTKQQVTEAQVTNVLRSFATMGKRGEVVNIIGVIVISLDGYFFQFGK